MEFIGGFVFLGVLAVFAVPIGQLFRRFLSGQDRTLRLTLLLAAVSVLVLLPIWSECHYLFLDEPLYFAARSGNAREVKELLARGASPEATFKGPQTAMQAAQEGGFADVVKILREAGAQR